MLLEKFPAVASVSGFQYFVSREVKGIAEYLANGMIVFGNKDCLGSFMIVRVFRAVLWEYVEMFFSDREVYLKDSTLSFFTVYPYITPRLFDAPIDCG